MTDSQLNPKFVQACQYIAQGAGVKKACENAHFQQEDFFTCLRLSEEAGRIYTRAREIRADFRFENAENILAELRMGLYDANTARVMLDAVKWQTAKEKPKVYGDSTILRGDKENPLDIGLANLLDAAAQRRTLAAPDVIEGQYTVLPAAESVPTDKKPNDFI